jgi:hypothetical protein
MMTDGSFNAPSVKAARHDARNTMPSLTATRNRLENRIMANRNRTTSTARRATAAKATVAVEQPAPIGGLDAISKRMDYVMMASHDAQNLAGLLETLSGVGYRNALAAKDEWQQKWWERATYLASTLERLGEELQSNGEAIETALYAIGKGGAA